MDFEILKTKKELDNLILDFKRFNTAFRFVSLAVYILFIIYSLAAGTGYLALNIILLALSVLYTAFAAVCTVREARGLNSSKADKLASLIYHWAKFVAMLVSAGLSIAGILTAVEHTTPLSIVLAILLPVCLVLQLIFDLVIVWVTVRVNRFKLAISQDIEVLKRDMVKLALGLVKDALFNRNKEKKEKNESSLLKEEEGDIIIVGSDEALSVKAMKQTQDNTMPKRENTIGKIFKKIFTEKKNKKASSNFPAEEDMQTEEE